MGARTSGSGSGTHQPRERKGGGLVFVYDFLAHIFSD